ncbi:DUF3761 domain-containing protein [Rhodococcus sp. MSC1_016]|uniref:DUF3761 domain-containing protein n=1 Tax=Rhodococcus sp. MSC1_016 TaxID=2909266 RepID=UPI00135BBE5E
MTGFDDAGLSTWSDDVAVEGGRNGCDTRNDILRRDLTTVVLVPGSRGCVVRSGQLQDPYSGKILAFTSDNEGPFATVEIDRVVALADARRTGAQQLDEQTVRALANDPRNLQAVDGTASRQKAGRDASAWLPPNATYHCTYVAQQVDVKSIYRLAVSQQERDTIARVLGGCGATLPPPPPPPVAQTITNVAPPPPPATTLPSVQQEVPRVAPIAPPPAPVAPAPPPPPPPPPAPAPAPDPEPWGGYGCGEGYYENSAGNCIPVPGASPTGASARCKDGTYSYSESRRGTCSGHGGVAEWY